ncbi:MAG: hypothetical protein K9L22_00155 [Methylococcaceae bacterium]|nr:hypothetical protein [Methylococcaceae bacterium]
MLNSGVKDYVVSKISFDKNNVFEQKIRVVSKIKVKSAEPLPIKRLWFFFTQDNSMYDDGFVFESDSPVVKTILLQSNIEKRLQYHKGER